MLEGIKRLLPLSIALLCACSSLSQHESLDEPLPPPGERGSIGAWSLGDDNCTGAIQTADGHHFWVTSCKAMIGYGWCEFGLRLEKRGPREFVNERKGWRLTLAEDGTLTHLRKGERVGQYPKSDTGICGVRAVK